MFKIWPSSVRGDDVYIQQLTTDESWILTAHMSTMYAEEQKKVKAIYTQEANDDM